MTAAIDTWLAQQTLPVQTEVRKFLGQQPDDGEEFMQDLMGAAATLKRGRVRLLYECWLAVPSKLVLEIACKAIPSRNALLEFIDLSANALLTRSDAQAFEADRLADDPLDEHLSWLRDHAYRRKLDTVAESGRAP